MIPTLVLSALLVFPVGQSPFSQSPNSQTTSPSFASHNDSTSSGDDDRKMVSPQSRAEAKRLYKEGVKYGRSGLPRQAAEIFEQALKLDPYYPEVYYGLGIAYYDLRQYEKAAQSLRDLIKLNPGDWEARDFLARVELELDRSRERPAPQLTETSKPAPDEFATVTEALKPALEKQTGGTESPKAGQPVTAPESQKREAQVTSPGSAETQVNTPTGELASVASPNSNTGEKPEEKSDLTAIYRVGAGDVLDVRLTDSTSNKSTLFTITPSGLLEHPSLPDPIPVAGLTVEEITIQLQAELQRRGLIENAKVWVGVRDYSSHAILVSGLVKEPGTKILRREAIPLYVVIADAQPLPEAGRLTLVRNQSNEFVSIELANAREMNRLVRPGDVITVHPHVVQFFYVSGEVKLPGEKTFRRGITLTQALMAAGGVTSKAKEARIARDRGDGYLILTPYKLKDIDSGKLRDPLLNPGDRITIAD